MMGYRVPPPPHYALTVREYEADLALWRADPDFARSLGIVEEPRNPRFPRAPARWRAATNSRGPG